MTLLTCGNDLLTCGNDLLTCENDFLTCGNDFLTCGNDFLFCGNNLLICGNDLLTCGNDLLTCGNEIKKCKEDSYMSLPGLRKVESVGTKINKLPVTVFLFCREQKKPVGGFEIQLIKKPPPNNHEI